MKTPNSFRAATAAQFFLKCRCSSSSGVQQSRAAAATTRRFQAQKLTIRQNHTQPADRLDFVSVVDAPARLVKAGGRHNKLGLAVLAVIPITAFILGTWQIFRLDWKTKLIAKYEDRLARAPLPLPPAIDPSQIPNFDYRRVYARGILRHDLEMLIGPRTHDGNDGYLVVTPFERDDGKGGRTRVLVNRGWISRDMKEQRKRDPSAVPNQEVLVEGLLREPWQKNMFTPDNKPEDGAFYFPDINEMAEHSGSQPVWVEETMDSDLLAAYDREAKGIPIGRAPEVNLRNNHFQYIFTWYSLSAITAVMLYMVIKKKPVDVSRRVRQNTSW